MNADQAKALYSNLSGQCSGNNRGNYCGGGGNRGVNHSSRGGKKRGRSKKGRNFKKDDFDPDKFCTIHGRQGHDAEHCRKAASDRKLEEQGGNGPRQSDRPYQPNYSHPYPMSTKVTRLVAYTTEIEPERDPNKWIVDSAANTYITSFKNTLQNYIVFDKTKTVKWFYNDSRVILSRRP